MAGAAQADKGDTLSALLRYHFINNISYSCPTLPSGRTEKLGAKSRLGYPTASQAGQNDEREPGGV